MALSGQTRHIVVTAASDPKRTQLGVEEAAETSVRPWF
jgi:hypothetical protein